MKIIATSLVLLCAALPLAVSAADGTNAARPVLRASDLFTNSIVAKGKGFSITRSQLDDALIGIKTAAATQGRNIPPEQMILLERQILQRLIQVQLLNSKATEADKAQGKEQTEKRIEGLKKQAGSDEIFTARLKSAGLSESELATRMQEELTAESVLKRELKVEVSDEEVKKYYEENPGKFEQPEMVKAAHVLISTRSPNSEADLSDEQKTAKRQIAEEVLKKARAGEDFAKLAAEYSDDPGSKERGGEYTFPRGQMVGPFEAAAFSLKTNQVSDIVTTQFGCHIIKALGRSPAKTATLEDEVVQFPNGMLIIKGVWIGAPEALESATKLSALIRDELQGAEMQKKIPEYLEKVEKEGQVEILDERLKPEPETATAPAGTGAQ